MDKFASRLFFYVIIGLVFFGVDVLVFAMATDPLSYFSDSCDLFITFAAYETFKFFSLLAVLTQIS